MIDPSQLGQAAAGFGILFGGLYGGWHARRSNQNSQDAKVAATQAAQSAYPISNGWGTALRSDVAETRRLLGQVHEAQVLQDRRLERMDAALQTHLLDHTREHTA